MTGIMVGTAFYKLSYLTTHNFVGTFPLFYEGEL